MVSITSCPLYRNCAVNTIKFYFCFSRSFHEIYVSIVNMYWSLLVSLFFHHFYLLISASIQLDVYHMTELGQHSCIDKLHYNCDDLQSLNIYISPISNSLCATINSLGIHASSKLCIRWKSRKRNPKQISEIDKIHSIQVIIFQSWLILKRVANQIGLIWLMFQFCHLFLNLDFLITLLEYLYSMPVLSLLQSSDQKLIILY